MLNINELREILSSEILNLQQEKTTPAKLNALVNATGKILSSIKLEMEYRKAIGKPPHILALTYEGDGLEKEG